MLLHAIPLHWLFGNRHENIQLHCLYPLLVIWTTAFKLKVVPLQRQTIQYFPFPFHTFSLLSLFVWDEVCVCVSVCAVCKHALICACAHACMSEQFDFSLCMRVKRTWRHVPFLSRPSSVQPQQGLSRARIKGAREEEKVPPQLIWPLWGEEHYSHWCSGRMAKTPRSFRKGLFKVWCDPKDWVGRWVLSPLWGRWEHCPCSAALIPLWTIGSLSWMG